jgi:DNA-binding GntR family transcriptional regulator
VSDKKPSLTERPIPERPYLREEVYTRLKEYVADVAANSADEIPIREADLTRVLGVSRTPVREALNRLHQEGLVVVLPRRGVRILPTRLTEYLAWLEVRETIDGIAAREAAQLVSEEALAGMRQLFKAFRNADLEDPAARPAFLEANARFHTAIVDESRNPVLARIYANYHYVESARRQIVHRPGLLSQALREHDEIIEALVARDSKRAERLARAHVKSVRESVLKSLPRDAPSRLA